MYFIRRVRGLDAALEYQKITKQYLDIEFPISYLRRSKIFGIYDGDNNLVGGFLIVMEGQLRSFESLPSLTYLPKSVDRWDVAEINCLWLAPELRKSFFSIVFWLFVILQLILSGRKYFTYTYSTEKINLRNFYARAKPILIFEGKTKQLEGMTEEEVESIELVSRFNIILAPIRNLNLILRRSFYSIFQKVNSVVESE